MLHHLFEKAAFLNYNKTALIFKEDRLTYGQLNERANHLASELINNDAGCGTLVGVFMDQSIEMIIGMLAVLKAGGAYIPIDPGYPDERIKYIIENSPPQVILTNTEETSKRISGYGINCISVHKSLDLMIEQSNPTTKAMESCMTNPELPLNEDMLAYIIYTSGSTGVPKGVMVEHRSVVCLMEAMASTFTFSSSDVWTLFHSIGFDFSVGEIYGALVTGGTLVIVPSETRKNVREFRQLLINNKVTVLNQTPSAFYILQLEEFKHTDRQLSLTHIIFCGEKLNLTYLKDWKSKYVGTMLINMYGITETTVFTTYKEIQEDDIESGYCNIGTSLPRNTTHLLDDTLNPVLVGEVGEIFIGGAGVARGYHNNPILTKEKFLCVPSVSKGILYRTGDLARLLKNGDIEYIGRTDNQVKIRGHRIELEEIETHLDQFEGFKQSIAVVLGSEETDKSLGVFYTSESYIDPCDIKKFLSKKLPKYMIPSVFKRIEKFNLTFSGKIDRKSVLECAEVKTYEPQEAITMELNDIEKRIIEIIKSNLSGNLSIDITLDTYITYLAFDSITFIKMIIELESEFGLEFDDEMLLAETFPTVKSIVEYIESNR